MATEPSLAEGHLPMTQVRIRKDNAVLLQEAFASNSEGNCVASSWNEPVYLRVRFTVEASGTGSPLRIWAQLARNHISYAMETRRNVRIQPLAPLYGRKLKGEGNSVIDSRGRIVLYAEQGLSFHATLSEELNSIALREHQLDRNLCEFTLARKVGAALDLIFPFLPTSPEAFSGVRQVDYNKARRSVVACWQNQLAQGMQVTVPEKPLNQLWRFTVPALFIAADSYLNGDRVLKDTAHHYEAVWGTGLSMSVFDLLQRGYSREAAAYLEPFRNVKTRLPVPNTGTSFGSTEGFIGDPADYTSVCWVSDHGAILWAASEYYLLTRDREFLDRWLPSILEGVEWISRERARTKLRGGPGAGLMPAGRATDYDVPGQYFFTDAWTYRGLKAACRVFQAINHSEADSCTRERDNYQADFQKVFQEQVAHTIQWTDPSGARIPFIPWRVGQIDDANLHSFYLDAGPMILGAVGLVDPTHETMTWAMKWLTEGPDAGCGNPDWRDFSQRPCLRYEMSSSEPSYSWNIYLRFFRNEREKFLEGFYSLAAGDVSRRFLGAMETRDGIQDEPSSSVFIDNHLRNMLVFEDESCGGMELLRNAPSSWLKDRKEIRVEKAPTYFGPLSYEVHSTGNRVEALIEPPSRDHLNWIRLHLYHPSQMAIRHATINGTSLTPITGNTIEIKNPSGSLKIVAEF